MTAISLGLLFLASLLGPSPTGQDTQPAAVEPADLVVPAEVDLDGSFSFRVSVRMNAAPADLPTIASNKAWESGEIRDYTTNNSYGLGRESGALRGFALSVLPDGAWTWNAGDDGSRLDHRPEAADQGIADGDWHEIGFAVDRAMGVVHLFHDGRRVAIHDLQGVGGWASGASEIHFGSAPGIETKDPILLAGTLTREAVAAEFTGRFGEARKPASPVTWDGEPLKVLAWNIWHGGRRKGIDEGVQRVVEVIESSGADIVLMQETYGSGPRISGRLGFEYYLRSSNLSIMSRFPIRDVHRLFSGFRFGGATIELKPGVSIEAYSLWINYLPSVQQQLTAGATAANLAAADAKTRGAEMDAILEQLLPHLDQKAPVPVLVGGDFNSGSHLDWTEKSAHLGNHHGHIVPWPVSLSMQRAGFNDTFRTAHPDPVASPGHTWSPEFPDSHQDRIDYVYASQGDWRTVDSTVLNTHPSGWPSDHAAVLSTLELKDPAPTLKVMSYNIHYGIGMDEQKDLARIAAVLTAEEPDLVGLQEIGSKAMADELAALTGMSVVFGPSKGSDDAYGDAVLSRHPFTWVGNLSLPSASSSRYQAMAVDVDLTAVYGKGASVRFINTHYDWTDSIGSQASRRASSTVIELGLCADLRGPAILTGDLNALPSSLPLADLEELGWHVPALGQPLLTYGAPNPTKQIDYALIRPRTAWQVIESRVIDEPVASDHYPVVLSLRLVR